MLIDFKTLFPKYNIKPKGVLHVGASEGQETKTYSDFGIRNVCYIEAIPYVFDTLKNHVKKYPGKYTLINACITEKDNDEVVFNVANNGGQSSSILEFGTHVKEHPTVKFVRKIVLNTSRLDSILRTLPNDYDFLNIDLQGAELIALRSLGDMINRFKWIYIEVNRDELYKGCALIDDVDDYIEKFGFKRVETKWTNHGWGDCLAIKN